MCGRFFIGDGRPKTLAGTYRNKRAKSAHSGKYNVVGASVRGRLHIYNSSCREDAFASHSNGTWLAATVPDGLGSRPLSRYGASFSVDNLCTNIIDAMSNLGQNGILDGIFSAFSKTRTQLVEFASIHGTSVEEVNCTLLGLVLNLRTVEMGIGQIGDGLIVGLIPGKQALPLIKRPPTEQPGATYTLAQQDWHNYFRHKAISGDEARDFASIYLMTDGVADDCEYGPPDDILFRWATDMDREIRAYGPKIAAQRLVRWLAKCQARGNFDDRTLLVIYTDKGSIKPNDNSDGS